MIDETPGAAGGTERTMPVNAPAPTRRVRVLLRLLAVALIGGWLAVAAIGGPVFGTISTIENDDQASYLPASAEATKVQDLQASFYGGDTVPATVLFVRDGGIAPGDRSAVSGMASDLADVSGVEEVSPPIPSEDGRALQLIVSVDESADGGAVVGHMRDVLRDGHVTGLAGWVTGPVALGADFGAGFSGLDGVLLIVALAAVFVILLIVYRSLLLPIAVLAVSSFALTGSILVVYLVAKAGWITVTGQSRGILAILAIGAATDYALLLVARYREALLREPSPLVALWSAWRRTIAPIGASAATVILAVLCLGFSDLNSNKGLGPVAAIAIAFAFLAATTALPAILALLGRAAFWPLVPRVRPADAPVRRSRVWDAVGRLVARRPRTVWVVTALVLGALATGVFGLQAAGVPQSDLLLTASQSVAGEKELAKHYDAGSGTPAVIVAPEGVRDDVLAAAKDVRHVASATVFTGERGRPGGEPKVIDGRVLIEATLSVAADSDAAQRTVAELRTKLGAIDPHVLVGGSSALDLDTNAAAQRDLRVVIPIVLAVILVILVLLLRSLVAPLVLVATVVLSYGATLGVAALVFNGVLRFPGADATVPLFGFVFLVALGVDYNIFLMTRVREETTALGHRRGVVAGLQATGGVITSAGIVLAATFSALATIPILFLVQIAFIVAFGVLLDTFVVRTLLVPALAIHVGRAFWWPAPRSRGRTAIAP
jgi:RND superfamily putative drug exporter